MTCPRSGRAPSSPACEPRKLDADSAARAAHLAQGRDAETGGLRGRRDAFGLTRHPVAGALRPAQTPRISGWARSTQATPTRGGPRGRDPLAEPRPRSGPPTPRRRSAHAQTSLWAAVRATRATCWPASASPVPPAPATFLGPVALIKARACLGCWAGLRRGGGELPAHLAVGAPRGSTAVGNDEVALGGPGASGSWDLGAWQGLCGAPGWEVALRWT